MVNFARDVPADVSVLVVVEFMEVALDMLAGLAVVAVDGCGGCCRLGTLSGAFCCGCGSTCNGDSCCG